MHAVRPDGPVAQVGKIGGFPVEMIIALALIVVSALLIVFIVRTVQANMPKA